ncbi:hypothetical protein UA3_00330, partial [Enterococcus faecium EnGen0263]|uniref:hypothetical protein n=1 Tax=Enterococcus faecium TaxID=1352 RepID=UPI0003310121
MKKFKLIKSFQYFTLVSLFSTSLAFVTNHPVNADDKKLNTEQTPPASDSSNLAKVPESLKAADTNITTLMLKVIDNEVDK